MERDFTLSGIHDFVQQVARYDSCCTNKPSTERDFTLSDVYATL